MKQVLVTGGGGFLGMAIVRQLLQRSIRVRSCSRGDYPALQAMGVPHYRVDLSQDQAALLRAAEGCDTVFHVAAKAGVWGPIEEYRRANVQATAQVIACCRELGIARLVHTSSPSVVFDGRDMEGVDESLPYPRHYEAAYPQTKAEAERMVLAANDRKLATTALRPHLIWGPGDRHLLPRILQRARQGRLRRIGKRRCLVDTVYVDNAAEAHLLAADRLRPGAPPAGRAYFIANDEPIDLWEMIDRMLEAADLPPVRSSLPTPLAMGTAALLEGIHRLLRLEREPMLTRFVVREMSTAHWFDLRAAERDLGYRPRISLDEGLRRLRQWLKEQ